MPRLRSLPFRREMVLEALAVVGFFVAVAIFATWPLAAHPLGGFYGFGNDNWGGIPYLGWIHDAYLGPGDPLFDPEFQAPFGLELPQYALQPMDGLFSLLLGGFKQGLGAYNAQMFLSFVLAGCTMYFVARYITGSRLGALVAGFIFTFSPFHLSFGMQYNALASIQWVPLYLLALLVLLHKGRRRDAALTGASFALVAVTSYYYAWFLAWFTLLVLGYYVVRVALRRRRAGLPLGARQFLRLGLSRAAIAGGVALVLTAPLLASSARGAAEAGSQTINHPLTEGVRYSARPWMLALPPHDNPIVGERLRPWVSQHLFDSPVYEQSIFLGYTALALAAFALWRRPRELSERALFARGLLAAGVFAGLLIMMGPYLPLERGYWQHWQTPGATNHLPSLGWVMFELAPVFRFFTRAFVLVSACLSILAAIGFARLERRLGVGLARRGALAAATLVLVSLEFTNAPPHVWTSADSPAWVGAVRRLPADSSVVDYPLAAAFSPRSLYYMFWQSQHRRATMNPQVKPAAAGLAAAIASPDDPASGEALHRAGIDFAVVHTRLPPPTRIPYQPGLPDDSMPTYAGSLNPWFRMARRTPDAVIYQVLNTPRKTAGALIRADAGFGAREPEGNYGARWLEGSSGDLLLYVTGPRRPLRAALTLSSFAQPRHVQVSVNGTSVAEFDVVPPAYVTRAIPLGTLASGRYRIRIEVTPGAQSIQETIGTPDPRSVSIRLREPILALSGAG